MNTYTYGFNGKENDNEVKGVGNQQDYGMRIYDPRVGRFLSVDPLTIKYPELTPYQFASNAVIGNTDLDGLELFPSYKALKINSPVTRVLKDVEIRNINLKKAVVSAGFKLGFSEELPKKLINHYSFGNGSQMTLSEKQMMDIHSQQVGIQGLDPVDLKQFHDLLMQTPKGKSVQLKEWRVLSGSGVSGTLGTFTVVFNGTFTKDDNYFYKWTFRGKMSFEDNWNFNSHNSAVNSGKRSLRTEEGAKLTDFAKKYLIGKPFDVSSVGVNVVQNSDDNFVNWFKDKPFIAVPNRASNVKSDSEKVKTDGTKY
ncbi:RHS repeat domain-containing protein [Mucilaginibacter glaciei]|uniref:RHS repeat-associated protein n=1 Tax=Mucilaginibacter glaciei TaxID=2772109 RepID=A0A926NVQ0_9SPHI|nr:RHS repeat-associated core domain-containing protein [Mucilaginibacter glaciei]MBD1395437.1 hypothetical protein [Mucilaginibacter glaciei]